MATTNDYFATEKDVASIAGYDQSSYGNHFLTFSVINGSQWQNNIYVSNAASYKLSEYVPKKYISKRRATYGGYTCEVPCRFTFSSYGFNPQTIGAMLFIQSIDDPNDVNYFDHKFDASTGINFYNGMVGKIIEDLTFMSVSSSGKTFSSNGAKIDITNLTLGADLLGETYFILVVIYQDKTSNPPPIAYFVGLGNPLYVENYWQTTAYNQNELQQLKLVNSVSEIPYRMFYDESTKKWRCLLPGGSYGPDLDYFYTKQS